MLVEAITEGEASSILGARRVFLRSQQLERPSGLVYLDQELGMGERPADELAFDRR